MINLEKATTRCCSLKRWQNPKNDTLFSPFRSNFVVKNIKSKLLNFNIKVFGAMEYSSEV